MYIYIYTHLLYTHMCIYIYQTYRYSITHYYTYCIYIYMIIYTLYMWTTLTTAPRVFAIPINSPFFVEMNDQVLVFEKWLSV